MKKRLSALFIILAILLCSSCGIKEGRFGITNGCAWAITVRVKSDNFDETVYIKKGRSASVHLDYGETYSIIVGDGLSSELSVFKYKVDGILSSSVKIVWHDFEYWLQG